MFGRIAIAALVLLTPPGTPSGGFRWQRIITPPAAGAHVPACVVLDADTFAHAAPALRDLRLFQDGSELPYVIEESYDERALATGVTPVDDRSEYETVAAVPLSAVETDGSRQRQPNAGKAFALLELPPHVPVERLSLSMAPGAAAAVEVRANPLTSQQSERMDGVIAGGSVSLPLTIGANLQSAARVHIAVAAAVPAHEQVLLQMRRRSLCYEPRSATPLTLYLGGGEGMAGKTYSLAGSFSTAIERPFATMGPLLPNPEEQHANPVRGWHRVFVLGMIGCCVLLLALTIRVARQRMAGTVKRSMENV